MKTSTVLGILGLSLCTGLAHAEGDPVAGKYKAETCMGCHGIPGYRNAAPAYHVPKLGDQHAEYIIAALKAYKNGERNHPTMHAQASSLSDQDMADIAAFFANLKAN
jgi:cytochrome c553